MTTRDRDCPEASGCYDEGYAQGNSKPYFEMTSTLQIRKY